MKGAHPPADFEALLAPDPISVDLGDFSPAVAPLVLEVLRLFDACGASRPAQAASRLVTLERLQMLSPSERAELRAEAEERPLLLCPGTEGSIVFDKPVFTTLADFAGLDLSGPRVSRVSRYTFGRTTELWPFAGLTLEEERPRALAALAPCASVIPLLRAEHGSVFVRIERGRGIYLSLVPLEPPENGLLKLELRPERFAALLPLFVVLRAALAGRGWVLPVPRATFMIDDPNLRRAHYGFLDLQRLVDLGAAHNFHTSLAMIPLDYRKTTRSAAALVRRSPARLSLVPHGVDHLRGEFARDVALDAAEAILAEGLARMEVHEERTGIPYARALTFPHGLCNERWLEAMRNVGLDAAIASRSFPWRGPADLDEPLYELYPAEMTFRGFPVINRFPAELPRERLLFQALLGKPLVVYAHHTFFRDGFGRLLELAEFLNRQIEPRWASVDAIVRSNYELRRRGDGLAVRAFSNRLSIATELGSPTVVLKPGDDFPVDEVCRLDSTRVVPIRTSLGHVAAVPKPSAGELEVAFEPARPGGRRARARRGRLKSRGRRFATEARDQLVLPATASALRVRQRIGRSFR